MKFYKFWARGEATLDRGGRIGKVSAYGGSNQGISDALRQARLNAERIAIALQRGQARAQYAYSDRPLREEIVQEIAATNGVAALVTRNAYGALVLNSPRVMFVDVDHHSSHGNALSFGQTLSRLWKMFVGESQAQADERHQKLISRFESVVRTQPGMGVRVYRTAAGMRLIVTNSTFEPTARETKQLLLAFGSDPLYMQLCNVQECFRARLSAKFWRCGATRPPSRFPWVDAAQEAEYREWEQAYHRHANQFATCEFTQSLGNLEIHADVAPVLEMHDRLTIQPGCPLA